jgi:hypothetical protein
MHDDNINWDLVQKNMEDDADEVKDYYKKEFVIEDYSDIEDVAQLMAKAYLHSKNNSKQSDAYDNWTFPDKYAYAVLGMIEEYYQYEKESAEYDKECDLRDADEPCYVEW